MKILFLSAWFPYPTDNGSKIRIFNLVKQLAARHQVALMAFHDPRQVPSDDELGAMAPYCSSVWTSPRRAFHRTSSVALRAVLSPVPRYLVDIFCQDFASVVAERVRTNRYDLVVASEWSMIPYVLPFGGVPRLLEDVEVSSFWDAARPGVRLDQRLRGLPTWLKLRAYLRRHLASFAACTVVSDAERALLRQVAPRYQAVHLVPNAVDLSTYGKVSAAPEPRTMLFAGSPTYGPNLEAARWFSQNVWPEVRRRVSGAVLRLTGDYSQVDPSRVPRGDGIELTGYVADIHALVAGSWASVVPIRQGSGTRLKILESMALGTPVVSTTKGAEGLDVTDGENVLIANEPADLAERVVELMRSPALRERIGTAGRQLVTERYDWQVVGPQLCRIVEQAALAPAGEP